MANETLTVPCRCGNKLTASGDAANLNVRLECDCGRAYAVTVTPLTNENGGAERKTAGNDLRGR